VKSDVPACPSVVSKIAHEACTEAVQSSIPVPWWDHLDPLFYATPEGFDLELRDKTMVKACAAMDTALRTAGAFTVAYTALPIGYNPVRLRRDIADGDFYAAAAEARDPSLFFHPPRLRTVPVRSRKPRHRHFQPDDGVCEKLTFVSPFRTVNPRLANSYGRLSGNRIAHARYWRHLDGPRPTVIALHGFYADGYWLNEQLFAIKVLYSLGCDVVLFTMPFHGPRQGRLSPFSGHGFFAGGAAVINEAFAQLVHDVRLMMNYLEDIRGVEAIGVTGISLGGYTSALLAAVEPRIHFALPNVPVATIPDLLMEWTPISNVFRALLRAMKLSLIDARRFMAVHCPLTYTPLLDKDRLMVIGGVGDRLAPPKHTRLLWEHWGRCRLHWFPGSHMLHLDRGEYIFEIELFLREIGFLR
jgi:pimeloyl-ACP methyl ester carboxylesterase